MTPRTITIPPVTAALLAHGVTDWSTHDFRGSVQVGDRGIIVAGAGPVRSEDVPEGWFATEADEIVGIGPMLSNGNEWHHLHFRAARAVGTVAEVVPITKCSGKRHICNQLNDVLLDHSPLHEPHADGETEHDISHLLPYSDWSPTTEHKQRWAVRWEDMRVIEPAVTVWQWECSTCVQDWTGGSSLSSACTRCPECKGSRKHKRPVPLHRGWLVANPGLVAAVGEASDGA